MTLLNSSPLSIVGDRLVIRTTRAQFIAGLLFGVALFLAGLIIAYAMFAFPSRESRPRHFSMPPTTMRYYTDLPASEKVGLIILVSVWGGAFATIGLVVLFKTLASHLHPWTIDRRAAVITHRHHAWPFAHFARLHIAPDTVMSTPLSVTLWLVRTSDRPIRLRRTIIPKVGQTRLAAHALLPLASTISEFTSLPLTLHDSCD